jgi:hypothetical protein
LKSYVLSPFSDEAEMQSIIDCVLAAKTQLENEEWKMNSTSTCGGEHH